MSDFITAGIRTLVPYIVGGIATWLISLGLTVSDDLKTNLAALATFVLGSVYYLVVKALEAKWPKLGVLLGVPKAPVYHPVPDVDEDADEAALQG